MFCLSRYGRVCTLILILELLTPSKALSQTSNSSDGIGEIYESSRHDFRVVTVVEGLENPWSIAWLPTGEMLVTERPGRLRIIVDDELQPEPILGWPQVYKERGQGGFMDVVVHPEFSINRWLYLSYGKANADGSEGTTTVVRGRLEGNRVVNVQEIFESKAWGDNNNHFSGRMAFDLDNYLFLAVGDRMVTPDLLEEHPSQSLKNHMGAFVRLHDDGSVPSDNPFVGKSGALPEIWSYGHRNMQGLTVDPETGTVWANEHGPRGGDELNMIVRGGNYGWPLLSYGVHYSGEVFTTETSRDDMESPRFAWIPSIGISGLMIYTGDQFPWWHGNVFVGGLVGEQLVRVTLDSRKSVISTEKLLEGVLGRIREIRGGPDGFIYLTNENRAGDRLSNIFRLEPVKGEVQPPG